MKYLKFVYVCLFLCAALSSWAQVCTSRFICAERNFQRGRYAEARQSFLWCQSYCMGDLDQNSITEYIELCNQKLDAEKKALEAKREKIKEQEEQSRKQVENNKLIFFSCDAVMFDQAYTRFGGEITKALKKQGHKFTFDKEKALWIVVISVVAHEDSVFSQDKYYHVTTDASGSVMNTIYDIDYSFGESVNFASPYDYATAAEIIFRKDELINKILDDINFVIQ